MLNPRTESGDGDRFVQVIDLELLLVELINEILQGFSLPLLADEKLGVRLWPIEHAYELTNELLAELLEVTNRSGFQGVKPISGWTL